MAGGWGLGVGLSGVRVWQSEGAVTLERRHWKDIKFPEQGQKRALSRSGSRRRQDLRLQEHKHTSK